MKLLFILAVFVGLIVSCNPEPENMDENENNLNTSTLAYGNNLYNQVSLFISGRNSEQFKLIQKKDYYVNYQQKLDESWNQSGQKNMLLIQDWIKFNRLPLDDSLALFYPFSGPDFLYANAFFPNAKTYIMVGLENPGKLPNLTKMNDSQTSAYLYKLYHSLRNINQNGYFATLHMQNEFRDSSLNGIIHLICFYLSKTNHQIEKINFVQLDNFGNEKEKRNFELETDNINGLRIEFYSESQKALKTLYYFPFDLSDENLKENLGFIMFLNKFGLKNTFIKSASYLLHEKEFAIIQDIIIKQSDKILQDDSGIPFTKLQNSGFHLQLFGNYTQTLKIFSNYFQPDLAQALRVLKVKDLPFKLGYNSDKDEMVLIYARQNSGNINKPITYKTEKEGVVFKVQFKSSWKKIPADSPVFKGLPKVDYYYTDNLYKYTIGNFSSQEACEEYLKIAATKGFKDAFVVAFYQKNRISLEEAERIIKSN